MRMLSWLLVGLFLAPAWCAAADDAEGWIPLFDGKTLDGWKANEDPASFKVEDGAIVAHAVGGRCHLFYVGDVKGANFKNFDFQADVMTTPGSNGGIYFHTEFQPDGWPAKGYEVQVNNTHRDPKKTGGLYAVQDVFEAPAKDNEWFTERIRVRGKHVEVWVNGKKLVDYTEPEKVEPPQNMPGRVISSGTFAFQAHDPMSTVYFKNIRVKPLPDDAK